MSSDIEKLQFPIGRYIFPSDFNSDKLKNAISDIADLPSRLKLELNKLKDEDLETPYRPDGWTVRQVVHHLADSHMNSIIRFKLALTEDKPVIKPYIESKWAEMVDEKNHPISSSLSILDGVHERLSFLLSSLTEHDLDRTFIHPEYQKEYSLRENIFLYSWHGNHHLAHIQLASNK